MRNSRRARPLALACVVLLSLSTGALAVAPQRAVLDETTLARLAALPRATGHSEIRADYNAARDETRVWINTNEDDSRLWSRAGGQMDMEFRVSAIISGRAGTSVPPFVSVELATLGELRPASPPLGLGLSADGRPVPLTERSEPEARSGNLLFLTVQSRIPLAEFLRLVTASRVEGRIWGHEFALQASQLELLRAYAAKLVATS